MQIKKASYWDIKPIDKFISESKVIGMTSFENLGSKLKTDDVFILLDNEEIIGITMIRNQPSGVMYINTTNGHHDIPYNGSKLLGGTLVSTKYRGRGLGYKLSEFRINYLKESGYTGQVISEIRGSMKIGECHPESQPAYNNLRKLGFKKTKYVAADDLGPVLEMTL